MNFSVVSLFMSNLEKSSVFSSKNTYIWGSIFKNSIGGAYSSSTPKKFVMFRQSEFLKILLTPIVLEMHINSIFYQNQVWNTDTSLQINNCRFINCQGQFSGGFLCTYKSCSVDLSETSFLNCIASTSTANGYRASVSSGAFIANCLSVIMQKNCFSGCYGIGDGFVLHSSVTGNNTFNTSCVINCGNSHSIHFGILLDYGYQYFVNNNGTSNICSGFGSFAAPCTLSTFFHVSYSSIVNNSDSLTSFGFGGHNLPGYPFIGYLNIINNNPKNSIFCSWTKAFHIYYSCFLGSSPIIHTAYSSSLTLNYCSSDTSFSSVLTNICYPNNHSISTIPVFNIECNFDAPMTIKYRTRVIIPTLYVFYLY